MEQLEPENSAYNICRAARVTGPLNLVALEASLNEIVRRHEVFRTTFSTVAGSPVQVIASEANVKLDSVILAEERGESIRRSGEGRNPDSDGTELNHFITDFARRPFKLNEAPMLRAAVISLGDQEHVLVLATHHIVADAWSMGILTRELWALYESYASNKPISLPDLTVQYIDYSVWQREWLQGDALESQLGYWKKQLGGTLPVLNLPTDYPRPARQTFHGTRVALSLSVELTEALNDLSRHEGVTLFMTLLAVFNILLHRYTGEEDVLVGSPVANRNRPEIQGLIGFFVNTLVLRTDLSNSPSFRELLSRVRDVCLDAYAHQDLPFEKLVTELQPERDLSRNPLFQVMFILQNAPRHVPAVPQLKIERMDVETTVSKFDLTLGLAERDGKLSGFIDYYTDLFDRGRIERMVGHFRTLLEGMVANPDQPISTLPILTEPERHQILVEWNDTAADYPKDSCIHELFEAQVEKTPDAVAVEFEGNHLTYRELNRRANQLAHYLRGLGVGPEKLVGVYLERSAEMVVALFGILKAGGAYVPLDPAYPTERLAFMVEDAQLLLIISQQSVASGRLSVVGGDQHSLPRGPRSAVGGPPNNVPDGRPSAVGGPRFVSLDSDWSLIQRESTDKPKAGTMSHNLAYVIYTSGSTGNPKGVAIEHRNTCNLLYWAKSVYSHDELAGVLASTSICFDLSVFELFVPLSWGGKVVLAETALHLEEVAKQHEVTVLNTVPSVMIELLTGKLPESIRTVNLAGEPLTSELVNRIYETGTVEKVYDLYGPSETTTYSTFTLRSPNGPATIGRPILNTQICILDKQFQPVPIGVTGEIYIGGAGVGRGYLNRPEFTTDRFIHSPFNATLYKTGDLARYREDGSIEFFGRVDNQVKIRGYRIELGEIEAVLDHHPEVDDCVIVATDCGSSGQKELIGYVVPKLPGSLAATKLRSFLRQKLPDYMIPVDFVMLDSLPRLSNGKVDRQKLPDPDMDRLQISGEFARPRTEIEQLIAQVWNEVLGLEDVGTQDNFFELGGHSLLAVQIVSRLRDAFNSEVPLQVIFEAPTVADLAKRIETLIREGHGPELPPIVPVPRDGPLPLSFNQEHLWRLDQMIPGTHFFNMPYVYRLSGELQIDALEKSLKEIIRRHEALRTVFTEVNGRPVQLIKREVDFKLPVYDLRAQSPDTLSQKATVLIFAERKQPFDLSAGPLLRTKLLRLTATEHLLLVTLHHIISDQWSMQIFWGNLLELYKAYCEGHTSPVAEPSLQFADYALWERQALDNGILDDQVAYWKQQLCSQTPEVRLRDDQSTHYDTELDMSSHFIQADGLLVAKIKTHAQTVNCSTFMVVLGALVILLYLCTKRQDLRIGVLTANRGRRSIQSIIGPFVNTTILCVHVESYMTCREILTQARAATLSAVQNQNVPFEYLAQLLEQDQGLDRRSLFRVLVNYQNRRPNLVQIPGLKCAPLDLQHLLVGAPTVLTQHDLIFDLRDSLTELSGTVNYKTQLFDRKAVSELIECLYTVLYVMTAEPDTTIETLDRRLMPRSREQAVWA